jgi:hypothetical protein
MFPAPLAVIIQHLIQFKKQREVERERNKEKETHTKREEKNRERLKGFESDQKKRQRY